MFYGINSGNYINDKFSEKNYKELSKAKMITISPLEMTVKNR